MKKYMSLTVASLLLGLSGCAKEVVVPPSAELPAVIGEAKATKDPNGNTRVRLRVEHMAPPQNLQPPKSVYVVWVETPEKQRFNLGQLRVDEKRRGQLDATTAFKVFRLVVTPEDFPTVTEPTGPEVLATGVLEAK
ncbi:hypothetical protein [Geotalea toluenoxydans]